MPQPRPSSLPQFETGRERDAVSPRALTALPLGIDPDKPPIPELPAFDQLWDSLGIEEGRYVPNTVQPSHVMPHGSGLAPATRPYEQPLCMDQSPFSMTTPDWPTAPPSSPDDPLLSSLAISPVILPPLEPPGLAMNFVSSGDDFGALDLPEPAFVESGLTVPSRHPAEMVYRPRNPPANAPMTTRYQPGQVSSCALEGLEHQALFIQ